MEKSCDMTKESMIFDLRQVLKLEIGVLDLCQFLESIITSQVDRKKIRRIAKDEENHIEIVKKLIEIVENNYIGKK